MYEYVYRQICLYMQCMQFLSKPDVFTWKVSICIKGIILSSSLKEGQYMYWNESPLLLLTSYPRFVHLLHVCTNQCSILILFSCFFIDVD